MNDAFPSSASPTTPAQPITLRSVLIGLLGSAFIAVVEPYNLQSIQGSYLSLDYSTPAAFALFFCLTAIFNPLAGLLRRGWALTSPELLVVFSLMGVATSLVTMGLGAQLAPNLVAPQYFADPGNQWDTRLLPYIQPARKLQLGDQVWTLIPEKVIVPQGEEVARAFYEGSRESTGVPWSAWAIPLAVWSLFLLLLYLGMICTMSLVRKQWVTHERLTFPIAQIPMAMSEGAPGQFFRNFWLWIGFALAFGIASLMALHRRYPEIFPFLPISTVPAWDVLGLGYDVKVIFRISLPMLGFFYLVRTDILFSLFFFNLLAVAVEWLMNSQGIKLQEQLSIYGSDSKPHFAHVGMGAFVMIILIGFHRARHHLWNVFKKALPSGSPAGVDGEDRDEILSYRGIVAGLLLSTVGCSLWLWMSGMPLGMSLVFYLTAMVIFLGLTRIVMEAGLAEISAPTIAPSATISAFGSQAYGGPAGLSALGFTFIWCGDIRTSVMATAGSGLKMCSHFAGDKRRLFWALFLTILLAASISVGLVLVLAYQEGALNQNDWFMSSGPKYHFKFPAHYIDHPNEVGNATWWWGRGLTALGAGVVLLLELSRRIWFWWPLHGIGFCVATNWLMYDLWFTAFLAWLVKLAVTRWGGMGAYRLSRNFFFGLILGQYTAIAFWVAVDYFKGGKGYTIFWI
ncbi:MAG: hypothetical protein HYU36_23320 [Planctomycetes bacterium]|nr:hypothetical protein [Planctomycetota bacterium]